MKDFESSELAGLETIRSKFLETCGAFGFELMDPSPIELVSVIEAKSGPAIRDEIYFFTDKGDREVALRFDFTVGLTRYVVSQKSLKLPAKIAAFGGVWRYDEPQKGRYRYFHQWDLEIYGRPSLESDAEIIEFTSKFFSRLGLGNVTINISHRGLVESVVTRTFGSGDPGLVPEIFRAIDKVQKKGRDEIVAEYAQKGHDADKLRAILEFCAIRGAPEEVEKRCDVSGIPAWGELKSLFESLRARNVHNVTVNFGIVRGLDYYSGVVFEAFDDSGIGALVGGGRYDSLPKAFGRDDMGATGVAGGVERIALSLEAQGMRAQRPRPRVSVLYVSEQTLRTAVAIASSLRDGGVPTDIDLVGRPFRKQMENATGSQYCIIVAPKELEAGTVILKNMSDGTERLVGAGQVAAEAKKLFTQ